MRLVEGGVVGGFWGLRCPATSPSAGECGWSLGPGFWGAVLLGRFFPRGLGVPNNVALGRGVRLVPGARILRAVLLGGFGAQSAQQRRPRWT